jgi:DNA-directed RNA polymerase subunit RPC12/RpoP
MAQDEYRCAECGATFSTQAELAEHNRRVYSRYTCEDCGAVLTSERELEEHNRQLHPELQRTPR